MRSSSRLLALAASVTTVLAQTWCGKNFMSNQTVVPPGGQFVLPPQSSEPLLAFRCSPAFRPYLEEDGKNAAFVVDTRIVYDWINGASPVNLSSNSSGSSCGNLTVTIKVENISATQQVPLNTAGNEINLDISSLMAQKTPYNVSCYASYSPSSSQTQQFYANTSLLYLPDTNGSVTKTDLRTGSLWVRPANGSGSFAPFVPQGFYISFTNLVNNLSMINQLKADGFNTIHPIPPYNDTTVFAQVLNRTLELGLYIIFDMRTNYQNLTAVAAQVNAYKSLPNLLQWETAHEPDGNSDPFNASKATYDLIYQMDGYHPISIVLNCQDYNFSPYIEGADIVLEDAYPIGINATYSPVWNTPCTPDFGHCGCDNCKGGLIDIRSRIQTFKNRLDILGYDRSKAVWTTPQAFGSGAYWNTTPTGQQWAAIDLISFNHGAMGSMSFQYPTTTGNVTTIEGTATNFTGIVAENIQPFLINPEATYANYYYQGVDAGLWYNGTTYLLLVSNMVNTEVIVPWSAVGLGAITNATDPTQVRRILSVNQNFNTSSLNFLSGGIGIYTATPPS
ncbi:hypothetical protein V8B97DRAFT_1875292 [Scleroderma yunnanense]